MTTESDTWMVGEPKPAWMVEQEAEWARLEIEQIDEEFCPTCHTTNRHRSFAVTDGNAVCSRCGHIFGPAITAADTVIGFVLSEENALTPA